MRKDVRMGFAVGGIMLAVIIVAVLVIHRNKNAGKTVAFDPGKPAVSGGDVPLPDATSARPADAPADAAISPAPAVPEKPPVAAAPEPRPAQEERAARDETRWDALFASTSSDPIKAQLTASAPKPKSHKTAAPVESRKVASDSDASDSAPTDRAAQSDSGSPQPLSAKASGAANLSDPAPATSGGSDPARTHRVAAGETFVSISRAVYGDGKYFKAIQDANPTLTPEKLKPGVVIQVPPASQVKQSSGKSTRSSSSASAGASGPALDSSGKTYTVQKGDNLYKIAKKLYGKGEKEGDLYTANKQLIGPDSTRLKIGMVLQLPERPTATASR